MVINKELLDNLTEQARNSSRLRMNYDLRNSQYDGSQRMLNAVEPGTQIPIHRHRKTSETVVVLRGRVKWLYFDDKGERTCEFDVVAGGEMYGLSIPSGQWHTLESMESGSIVFTTKDGIWESLSEIDVLTLCLIK